MQIRFQRVLLTGLLFAQGWGLAQTRSSVLAVAISDCWGTPIQDVKVTVIRNGPIAFREWFEYPARKDIRLEEGRYTVVIEAPLFAPFATEVDVRENTPPLRACLTLGSLSGPTTYTVAKGTLSKSTPGPRAEEVRLMAIYSEVSLTTIPEENGDFLFLHVQPGRYVLLVLAGQTILSRQEVDVRSTPLAIQY